MNEDIAESLVKGSYVFYVKALEQQAGKTLSPMEVFMPEAMAAKQEFPFRNRGELEGMDYEKAVYLENLDQLLTSGYSEWIHDIRWLQGQVEYQYHLSGPEEHPEVSEEVSSVGTAAVQTADTGVMSLTIRYDSEGIPLIEGLVLPDMENYGEFFMEQMKNHLSEDPVDGAYQDEFRFTNGWAFQRPKDFSVSYTVNPDSWILAERQIDSSIYYWAGSVVMASFILMLFVGLMALLLPFIRGLGLTEAGLFRLPLEGVMVLGSGVITVAYGLVPMVSFSNSGHLRAELIEMNLLPKAAAILDKGVNILCWMTVFAGAYWCASCIRAVFTLGPWRYWKERTLIYRIYAWVKRLVVRFYVSMTEIDLRDKGNKNLLKIVGANFVVVSIFCFFWFLGIGGLILYSIVLFFVLRRYFADLREKYQILLKATNEIAEGNLDVSIDRELGIFEPFKGEIKKIQRGFKKAVAEEVRSQRLKTELITNVSHDLKTPLTAIITYVNLLKEEGVTEEERQSYIGILEQKSMRLKVLIEDLFEVSKATSKNVTLNLVDVDLVSLMKQVALELEDKIQASNVDFRWDFPDEKIQVKLDSQKTYRIFENLLVNITKYAQPHTRAYIAIRKDNGEAVITMKNISAGELNFTPEEITERFVRGDISRNTEGSGLGLAIAKSFTELQNGKFYIDVDADLFKAEIRWIIERKQEITE